MLTRSRTIEKFVFGAAAVAKGPNMSITKNVKNVCALTINGKKISVETKV